jgi:hypothetical protein
MEAGAALASVLSAFAPAVPWLIGLAVFWVIVAGPLPGRGPGYPRRRDRWRTFRFDSRRLVLERAGHRCESGIFLGWGRCDRPAEEVDHVYPWSKGGATVVSNGQALCRNHNCSKSAMAPPWWYVWSLERRRRTYVDHGVDVTVRASMNQLEREARAAWAEKQFARLERESEPAIRKAWRG